MMITTTILSSLVAAFTVIPLVATRMLSRPEPKVLLFITNKLTPFSNWMDRRTEDMANFTGWLLKHRYIGILMMIPFIVFTMKAVKPLNGGELMPMMDTGIGIIKFDTPTRFTPQQVLQTSHEVEKMVQETSEGLKWLSTKIGSEPGETSFGGGGETAQAVALTITLEDRKHRKASIWEIEKRWRKGLLKIDGVRTFEVTEYGATPLSTSKAPLDIVISGPDTAVLDTIADTVMNRLKGIRGLTDVRRSWYLDKEECSINVDPDLARFYGTTPAEVAKLLKSTVKGLPAATMRLKGSLDVPIVVQYTPDQIDEIEELQDVLIPTPHGNIPLRAMAEIKTVKKAPFITREDLSNTIDITGIHSGITIAQVGGQVKKRLKGIKLPADYKVQISGTLANMKAGSGEMGRALMIGVVLLYILLVWMYKSFMLPVTIMLSIILPIAAGVWGLFIFHKPMCKPAMMGMILLAGTVVNNAILLLDFILAARAEGMSKDEAILKAVHLRFRPIVMTAASTALGLTPLVFELAVGMERMSPLGIVAAFGLIMGIFSSTWIYPVIYSLFDSAAEKLKGTSMKTATAAAAILILFIIPLQAQEQALPATQPITDSSATNQVKMTLEQSIKYALENSPLLRISAAEAQALYGEVSTAKSERLPQIGLVGNLGYSQNGNPVRFGANPMDIRFANTTYSLRVEVTQLIYDFGRTGRRLEAIRRQAAAADIMQERRQDEISFRVSTLYHQRLMLDDIKKAATASEKSLQTLVSNIQKKLDAGKAAPLDLLKVQVKLAAIKSQLAELESQQTTVHSRLMTAMGYRGPRVNLIDTEFTPAPPITNTPILIAAAYQKRKDFLAATQQTEAGIAQEKSARNSRLPTIAATGSYGQYNGSNPEPGNKLGNNSEEWEDNYFIGAVISIPVFDSGLRSGKIASANAARMKAQALQNQLRLQIDSEIRSAAAELNSAKVREAAFRESAEAAARALADEQKMYDAGKAAINDLLDSESAKLLSDSQHSQAQHELEIAIVNLHLAAGEPLTDITEE
jgi:outer membrane protein TolC